MRDFDVVQKVANEFIACASEDLNKFEDIEIQANFPQKRIKKRKLMLGETTRLEVVTLEKKEEEMCLQSQ